LTREATAKEYYKDPSYPRITKHEHERFSLPRKARGCGFEGHMKDTAYGKTCQDTTTNVQFEADLQRKNSTTTTNLEMEKDTHTCVTKPGYLFL